MKKFKLACKITVSAYTEVRAETLADAIAQARRREVVLGGAGSGVHATESWIIDEADGLPSDIQADV